MALSKIPSAGFQDNVKFRNIIINGDMCIAQRSTSLTGLTTSGHFVCDRWRFGVDTSPGTYSMSQSTDVPTGQGFANSLKVECTTANSSLDSDDLMFIEQRFEGQMLQYLKKGTANAESTTLSLWVKSSQTGKRSVELRDQDNNRHISGTFTVSSANTWEKKTITFAGDTTGVFGNDNARSLDLKIFYTVGSRWTSGTLATSWQSRVDGNTADSTQAQLGSASGNNIYITGIQLEAGTTASDFEFLPVDVNTQRCLRYYQKSYAYGTALGAATDAGAYLSAFTVNASNQNYHTVNLQSIMRTSPTAVFYSSSTGATGKYRNASDAADYDATVSSITDKMLRFRPSSSTGVNDGDRFNFHFTLDAEL